MIPVPSDAAKPRILVVEDDEDIQMLLYTVLTRDGYAVETAANGAIGLSVLAGFAPDLILLDMAMPDMDGLTFLSRRAGMTEYRDIPVIVVSARDTNKDVMAAIELGADSYVTKPFDNAVLLTNVRRLLENAV